jgi:hypothetical protein
MEPTQKTGATSVGDTKIMRGKDAALPSTDMMGRRLSLSANIQAFIVCLLDMRLRLLLVVPLSFYYRATIFSVAAMGVPSRMKLPPGLKDPGLADASMIGVEFRLGEVHEVDSSITLKRVAQLNSGSVGSVAFIGRTIIYAVAIDHLSKGVT